MKWLGDTFIRTKNNQPDTSSVNYLSILSLLTPGRPPVFPIAGIHAARQPVAPGRNFRRILKSSCPVDSPDLWIPSPKDLQTILSSLLTLHSLESCPLSHLSLNVTSSESFSRHCLGSIGLQSLLTQLFFFGTVVTHFLLTYRLLSHLHASSAIAGLYPVGLVTTALASTHSRHLVIRRNRWLNKSITCSHHYLVGSFASISFIF